MIEEYVILVDEADQEIGHMEKMEVHRQGLLHRAFSVFVFNHKQELMIHQRASSKYHSGGLWTNTCCSHPRPGETIISAGKRRLQEEMGFTCELKNVHSFIYKASLDNELTEHEFDHILIGNYEQAPKPNPNEVQDWKWINLSDLKLSLDGNPEQYTYWFKIAFSKLVELNLLNI